MKIIRKSSIATSIHPVCVGPIATYVDRFAEFLAGEDYAPPTIKVQVCADSGSQPLVEATPSAARQTG